MISGHLGTMLLATTVVCGIGFRTDLLENMRIDCILQFLYMEQLGLLSLILICMIPQSVTGKSYILWLPLSFWYLFHMKQHKGHMFPLMKILVPSGRYALSVSCNCFSSEELEWSFSYTVNFAVVSEL